jgi:uncharacterized protein (TIGR03083 family)
MSDPDLGPLLRAMDQTWTSIVELGESLAPEEFALPTRCPGWDVHDQIAHVVSVEQLLAGGPLAPEAPPAAYIRNEFGAFMERGVQALRGTPPDELVELLRAAIEARRAALQADPPKAGGEVRGVMGNLVPAERSLPIRVFDLWAHEQDVRVAVGRLGNESGLAAQASRDAIVGMLPMHWAKAAEAAPGDVLVVRVTGGLDFQRVVVVADDGRADLADLADLAEQAPTATIELDWADLVARACGREAADRTPVVTRGDATMAQAVVDALPMSP